MSQKIGDAFVSIGARTDKLDKSVKKSSKKIESSFTKVNKALIGQFAKLGAGVAAAFSVQAISTFVSEATKLYDIQAKAEVKLLTALKGREDAQQRLIKQAQELQKISLFGDEETIEAQAMLASLGLNETAIRRLIPLVQDLATKSNMNLVAAADMVAKSVGSSTNALSRYGIEIEGAVGSADRLESAMESLNEQVGGQAEAAAKVGTGGIKQMENQISDLEEEIGGELIPTMLKLKELQLFFAKAAANKIALFTDEDVAIWEKIGKAMEMIDPVAFLSRKSFEMLIGETDKAAKANVNFERTQKALNDAVEMGLLSKDRALLVDNKLNSVQLDFLDQFGAEILAWQKKNDVVEIATEKVETLTRATEKLVEIQGKETPDMATPIGATGLVLPLQMLDEELDNSIEKAELWSSALSGAFRSVSSTMVQSLGLGETAMGRFAGTMIQATLDVIGQLLAMAIANAIAGGTAAALGTGFAALLTTPAFIAQQIGTVMGAFAAIPAFATGGQSSGGMALVGERGPELVNLPGGSMVTPNHQMNRGGMGYNIGDLAINGIVRGDNIIISSQRSITNNKRTKGF